MDYVLLSDLKAKLKKEIKRNGQFNWNYSLPKSQNLKFVTQKEKLINSGVGND